jgi:transposase
VIMAEVEIQSERVDDIPLLIGQQQKLGLAEVIDGIITPHWRRQGLSVGQTIVTWLTFILSEADHRLSYVEPWVAKHPETLRRLIHPALAEQEFSDDRLGDVLRYLSDDASWTTIEREVGQRTIRVYQLPLAYVRLDSTTVSLYHEPEGTALIRYGHSKDHRPDLAQLKVMLASLDPLGLPLVTQVVGGNRADDGLYGAAIDEARAVVGQKGLLYLGDSKMEALATRGHLVAGGDYYLAPLSLKGEQAELLAELVQEALSQQQLLFKVYRELDDDQEPSLIAQGYETSRSQTALVADQWLEWTERVLVIYSPALAQSASRGLESRLQRAEEKLLALTPAPGRGKRQYEELAPLQAEVEAILQHHRVTDLLQVSYQRQVSQRQVRQYKDRPARLEETVRYQLQLRRDEAALEAQYRTLGWRLYVLNAPAQQMSLAQAVLAYRGAPAIERDFARLKGRPLGLCPVYLQREDHLIGLVRLLSLALRVLTLSEFVVRRSLAAENEVLVGLYPGNPKQQTHRPTTERLLAAFKNITLSLVQLPGQTIIHITPLTPLQSRILNLLDLPTSLYTDLAANTQPIPP